MGSWPAGHWLGQRLFVLRTCLCVCVCTDIFSFRVLVLVWQIEKGRTHPLNYRLLPHWPLGELILACSSFNCFTLLISSSLSTSGGGVLFHSLLLLTSQPPASQASRLSEGEHSDWVISHTPVVRSHRLMLCQTPTLSTRFLSAPVCLNFCLFLSFLHVPLHVARHTRAFMRNQHF